MKTPFKFLLTFFCVVQLSFAYSNPFSYPTKSKTITKEFAVSSSALMEVKNRYGNVTVILWDENKINYDVTITVGAKNEKLTNELLDAINVNFTNTATTTNATTIFPKTMSGNKEIEVNYTIKIPRKAHANVEQKYGNVYIPELNGSLKLTCNYGNFTLGNINNKQNDLSLSYISSGKADYINYATLDVRYSTIKLDKINYFVAKGNYNTFKIENAGTFNFETSYTNIVCEKVQKIDITGNYLTLKLNKVGVSSIIKSNYTTVTQNITPQTEFIQYKGNYATIAIGNLNNQNFSFDISGSYLSLNSKLNLTYTTKISNGNLNQFIGTATNNRKLKINVESNYGTVAFKD